MGKKEELIKILDKKRVLDDADSLEMFSGDESFMPNRSPELVVRPKTVEEVQGIVNWAREGKTPLIPVSSGPPHFNGDTLPRIGGVVLDFGQMNKIIRMDRRNRVVMVEPGVTFEALLPELDKEGMRLSMPLLPRPNKSVLTFALDRSVHLMPRHHWDISDPLLCIEVVYGTGEVFWTGESAGPGSLEEQWKRGGAQKFPLGPHQVDYHRLVQGAQGTMGLATWASLKTEVKPTLQKLFFVADKSIDSMIDYAYQLIKLDLIDELFFLNNINLATILSNDADEIEAIRAKVPPTAMAFAVSGLKHFPEERIAYREADIKDKAQQYGLEVLESIGGFGGDAMLNKINKPSEGTYWKQRPKGACHDLFFITTLNKASGFIGSMQTIADEFDFPQANIGVYVQPIVQGTSCHVEFNLYCDPDDEPENEKVRAMYAAAVDKLQMQGAFFNRPFPFFAEQVFRRHGEYTVAARKMKQVFDPDHILNPGKLCF